MSSKKQLPLQLDFRSGLPIYIQIVEQVQRQIAAGGLKPGDQLPTVRALAQELSVNFNTVARAYRLLDEARVISTQHGRGTFISEIPPPKVSDRLRNKSFEALARGYIGESLRLGFSKQQIRQMVSDRLKTWQEDQDDI